MVLKISPPSRRGLFELVAASLAHLDGKPLPARVPRLVKSRSGAPFVTAGCDGKQRVACALTFVDGQPMATVRPRSMAALEELGGLLAALERALADFDHPGLGRDFPWRMEVAPDTIHERMDELGPEQTELVRSTLDRALVLLGRGGAYGAGLPPGVIHNDANDYNVMVSPRLDGVRLAGLIDFGDIARGWRVSDPAVAAAYAMMDLPDPVEAACALARGYSAVTSLEGSECRALLPLAALRLCLSVCIQTRQMKEQPDNDYLAVSQGPAWRLLARLARTDWRLAEFRVREACGLPPNPRRDKVVKWVAHDGSRMPVVPEEVLARPCVVDLSVASPAARGENLCRTESGGGAAGQQGDQGGLRGSAEDWVRRQVAEAGATAGVGRYGEARLLYDAPSFAAEGNDGPEARTVHLGLDLFAPAGTPVRAALSGTVLSVANNDRRLDFGPTVILRHETGDGTGFHTLYGHLDCATLRHLAPGAVVAAGDVVGWLGDRSVNGGWPPHLHLQLIALDPLSEPGGSGQGSPSPDRTIADREPGGNFPGVAVPGLRGVWEAVAPDPGALAGLPGWFLTQLAEPVLGTGVVSRRIRARRRARLGSSLSLSYDRPVHMVRGAGQYLFDAAGRRYLDAVNNVPHVGHANPRVAGAIARQAAVLNTNTRYLHGEIVALADELLALFPDPLDVLFLVCSGSEANELALRLARCHTGNDGVVVLEGGYHGNTGGLVEISPYKFDGPGGAGVGDRVAVAAMPDPYRGLYRRCGGGRGDDRPADEALGERYANDVAQAAARLDSRRGGPGVAAFVAEPILSCGGQIEPPEGYLAAAYRHIRRVGGVCVADEVQVGFGRVGDAFWAFELQGVVPDIVTLGKPMGNGHPVAAVVTTRKIADSFANGMEYFNTFGGNPVSCAAARAVLAEMRDGNLQERARRTGRALLTRLRDVAARRPIIGDVRGRGLFLGVELVRNRQTRTPFPEACTYVVNRMRARGVLMSADGPDHNVLKIKPPLVFNEDNAAELAATLDFVLGDSALEGT